MAIINAIKNGNFETEGSWVPFSPAAIVSDGNAMNSSRCLRFINRTTGGLQQAVQTMLLVKGTQYQLYFWAKRTGRMDVWAAYSYQDANGVLQTVHSPSMLNTVTGSYTRQYWSFTVPSSAISPVVNVFINSGGNPGDTATAWIDNVELWGEEYIMPLPDPGPHPAGYNHIVNGKFETAEAWQFVSPSSIVNDSLNAKEGTRCLRLPYKSTPGMQYAYQNVNLVPGKEYILSFYAKRSGRMDVWGGYSYTDINDSYQRVYGPSLLSQMPDNSGYRRQQYRFTVPTTASSNFCIYIHGGNDPIDVGVSAYVDDVVLVRTDGVSSGGGGSGSNELALQSALICARQTRIRSSCDNSSDTNVIHRFEDNTPIAIRQLSDTSDWYRTYVGQDPLVKAYVMANCVDSLDSLDAATRISNIANFYINKSKVNLNLADKWCQSFANVCVAQAGLADQNPWVNNSNAAEVWEDTTLPKVTEPRKGGLVFTRNNSDNVSHVAVITDVTDVGENGDFTVHEGDYNGSDYVTTRTMNTTNNTNIVGYGLPSGVEV